MLEGSGSEAGPGAGPGPSRVRGQDAGGLDLGMVLGLVLVLGLGPGPGLVGFVSGSWLELSGVVVAIGCFVYECLEHGLIFMQLLCLVIDLDVGSLYVNFIQVCLWR